MTAFTIQDVSRRSGLSEPTLRYYEEVGLIGPIDRDASSGHRRYSGEDVDTLQMLACLRAMGMGIEDMRTYQANRARGRAAAAEQRDLLLRHAERVEAEIETLRTHLDYLRDKAAVWDARDRGDELAEAAGLGAGTRRRRADGGGCDEPGSGHRRVRLRGHAADRGAAAGRDRRCAPRSGRSTARPDLRKAVRRGGADDAGLEVVAADLMADDGWAAAVAGVRTRSITSPRRSRRPAEGSRRADRARPRGHAAGAAGRARRRRPARGARPRRSPRSGYTPKPSAEFTEADWTDPDTPGLPPYPRSKAIAERAAWDFMERDGGGTELVVGQPDVHLRAHPDDRRGAPRLQLIKAMLDGTMTVAPRQRFGVVDVRDVADLHIRAMASARGRGQALPGASPTARRMSFLRGGRDPAPAARPARRARTHARRRPGASRRDRSSTTTARRDELGWRPRPAETTIVETAESLRDLGLVKTQSSPPPPPKGGGFQRSPAGVSCFIDDCPVREDSR